MQLKTVAPLKSLLNNMNTETVKSSTGQQRKRPMIITLLSLWLMFGVLGSVAGFVTPARSLIYPDGIFSLWGGIGLFYIMLMLMAAIGYWRMQPWGVYMFGLYTLLGIIQQQIFKMPASLEDSLNQIAGSPTLVTALTILYGAVYLMPGYLYIIRPRNKNK